MEYAGEGKGMEGNRWEERGRMGRMERNMVKGCKEMNGREGRGFNARDGICRGRKRDERK